MRRAVEEIRSSGRQKLYSITILSLTGWQKCIQNLTSRKEKLIQITVFLLPRALMETMGSFRLERRLCSVRYVRIPKNMLHLLPSLSNNCYNVCSIVNGSTPHFKSRGQFFNAWLRKRVASWGLITRAVFKAVTTNLAFLPGAVYSRLRPIFLLKTWKANSLLGKEYLLIRF